MKSEGHRRETMIAIACGHNNAVLGEVVDGNKKLLVEIGTIVCGDIILGGLTVLENFRGCETPTFSEMYEKYKDKINGLDNLYFIETSGLAGTIYACGHIKTGVWSVFAKTAGYA